MLPVFIVISGFYCNSALRWQRDWFYCTAGYFAHIEVAFGILIQTGQQNIELTMKNNGPHAHLDYQKQKLNNKLNI